GILSASVADSEGAEHEPEASQTKDDTDTTPGRQIMAEYLVRYMIGQKYGTGEAPIPIGATKTLVVNAQDRVDAFIQAYNRLTREGHHVGTWEFGNRHQRGDGEGSPFGFTDEEVHRIREVGVQIDRTPGGGAHIESITEYGLDVEGKPKAG